MTRPEIGYTRDLFILPFDHRGTFQERLFGIKDRLPSAAEAREISRYKKTIYLGFEKALAAGVPKESAGILADEQFGLEVLRDARVKGYLTACPAEKSGQEEFDFEYGELFSEHIGAMDPDFVKVLVRYNPEGDAELNKRQLGRLRRLSEYCHQNERKLMFELLVPATQAQLAAAGRDVARYDLQIRPELMVRAMRQIQDSGVEPDVWKLEGIENVADSLRVVEQARSGKGRSKVGVIVLGRGENAEKVRYWLTTAAKVPGIIGFAVGRTVFWEPLQAVREGRMSHDQAAQKIADNYKSFCDLWQSARELRATA